MSWPQQGKENVSRGTLRRCYSLNDKGFCQDQDRLKNEKSLLSRSLGEIVVSFDLSPSYLPREKPRGETEALDESLESKIVPMFANVRVQNRNRYYSANEVNDVFEEEIEWSVGTANRTCIDSIKSEETTEEGNAKKMDQYRGEKSPKKRDNGPVGCCEEMGMSRRRCYPASESDINSSNNSDQTMN